MKPMLASDWNEKSVLFPVMAQPKIDGVRALNLSGRLTGRSLKEHKNRYVTELFSHPALVGFDGEMVAEAATHPDLCRLTTSKVSTIEGQPFVQWWLFDYVDEGYLLTLPYAARLDALREKVDHVVRKYPQFEHHLRVIPNMLCQDMADLQRCIDTNEAAGYEGTILRDPSGLYKQGRSTARERGLLRVKQFVDAEAIVLGVVEGDSNQNEATINELGHTERSTHQANMIPNGLVGTLTCRALERVESGGRVVIDRGAEITISAGRLTSEERKFYFENPNEIIGRTIKFKFFPKGMKDKLRFPTFQSFRSAEDMS